MPAVWALADLHLAISKPEKRMDVFGPIWHDYDKKIAEEWHRCVKPDDLVLLAGDICWAMKLEQALQDLRWIDALPGTKVMIKGNHDYWWDSYTKMCKILPASIHAIQNNVFNYDSISIGGARLWDTTEYSFGNCIEYRENPLAHTKDYELDLEEQQKIYNRELMRLEMSLKELNPHAKWRIAMTHYPPLSIDLQNSRVTALLEKYQVDMCVFGHLHSLKPGLNMFGKKNNIAYHFTACDYLEFKPLHLLDF
ncbi:MAG: hypothetical protein K0S74_218 [Chlamydiales bacterium]|jgi:predicted phosphohydrolase|nr:hypothetical protein [Chlamydiales bacterium]